MMPDMKGTHAPLYDRHHSSPEAGMNSLVKSRNVSPGRGIFSLLGWNRSSFTLISAFALLLLLLGYVWWPLAAEYLAYIDWDGAWWRYIDWLLIAIFLFMSLMIMAHANLKVDANIIFVGLIGGLAIESWGTQTEIWTYYTDERPPLWIIPAWPIAALTTDRMVRFLNNRDPQTRRERGSLKIPNRSLGRIHKAAYWLIFPAFFGLMLSFVAPSFDEPMTILAILLVAFFIFTPTDHRLAVLTFAAGAGLGYFLELWGTTRECWTYYTLQTPPLFGVLAHGMAAVAFWRCSRISGRLYPLLRESILLPARAPSRKINS